MTKEMETHLVVGKREGGPRVLLASLFPRTAHTDEVDPENVVKI